MKMRRECRMERTALGERASNAPSVTELDEGASVLGAKGTGMGRRTDDLTASWVEKDGTTDRAILGEEQGPES